MKKIIVLGNGFDKAHGLPTLYTDFLNWDLNEDGSDKLNITKECEDFRKVKIYNIWIKYFCENKDKIGPDWTNFEDQFQQITNDLTYDMIREMRKDRGYMGAPYKFLPFLFQSFSIPERVSNRQSPYRFYNGTTVKYYENALDFFSKIKEIMYRNFIELKNFFKLYLEEKLLETDKLTKIDIINNLLFNSRKLVIFNFNYTNLIDKIYRINSDVYFCHSNGVSGGKIEGMVLGNDNIVNDDFSYMKKENQIYYNNIKNHNLNLDFTDEIIIIGHSINKFDHYLYKNIFQTFENYRMSDLPKIKVFYYDRLGKEMIINKLLQLKKIANTKVTEKILSIDNIEFIKYE